LYFIDYIEKKALTELIPFTSPPHLVGEVLSVIVILCYLARKLENDPKCKSDMKVPG
jgi:hypothetical protein